MHRALTEVYPPRGHLIEIAGFEFVVDTTSSDRVTGYSSVMRWLTAGPTSGGDDANSSVKLPVAGLDCIPKWR